MFVQTLCRFALVLALVVGGVAPAAAQDLPAMISLDIPPDKAHSQISVVVTKGLVKSSRLPTKALRLARQAMQDGKDISTADLKALADHWDGLAAQKYVRHLLDEEPGASPSDIAYYGTIAVSTGRVWTLPAVVAALRQLDPATEPKARIKAYAAMLYPHAWAGNSLAMDAVIDLNGEGKLFGPMSKATQKRVLEMADKGGDGRIPLRLALVLVQKPDRTPEDIDKARKYLAVAATATSLEVRATAENLLALINAGGAQMVPKS